MRELEGAIGYDCRFLNDGRRAVFRHTALHKRSRRAFFERRDAMLLLHSSFVSNASLGANPRLDLKDSSEMVDKCRRSFIKMAFPYLEIDEKPSEPKDYDAYFDELDAIEAEKAAEHGVKSSPAASSAEPAEFTVKT